MIGQMTDPLAPIIDRLIEGALGSTDLETIFAEACDAFDQTVFPVCRVHVSMTTLHPLFDISSITWHRGEGVSHNIFVMNEDADNEWQFSPFYHMMEVEPAYTRYFDLAETDHGFPVMRDLRNAGATGYLAVIQGFISPPQRAIDEEDGMVSSWVTDRPGGFSDVGMKAVNRLVSRFALCAKLHVREATADNIVHAYLGPDAGSRVLDGQIKLGDGESIKAAIWYSDMRQSTPLADRLPREDFLALVNNYFDATATAVIDNGGEVLRFVGDAVLAIFRIDENRTTEQAAAAALKAARDSVNRMEIHNKSVNEEGGEPFGLGIGLHIGEVIFGNIGIPSRIEFSVIGSAANETARLEGFSKTFECPIILSENLVAALPDKDGLTDQGPQTLRGVAHPITIFTTK